MRWAHLIIQRYDLTKALGIQFWRKSKGEVYFANLRTSHNLLNRVNG
jgi:hypothetical protein